MTRPSTPTRCVRRLSSAFQHQAWERFSGWREHLEAARETRAEAVWLTGREKHSGDALSAIYLGMPRSLDYLVDRLFAGHRVRSEPRGLPMWRVSGRVRDASRFVDLVIAELPWPYYRVVRWGPVLRVPPWVEQRIPLSPSWPAVIAGFRRTVRKDVLSTIRRFALSSAITTAPADLEHFYAAMYEPSANRRFGSLALVAERDEVFPPGAVLLQVRHENRVVSAVVISKASGSLCCLWAGIAEGLEGGLAEAAVTGLYYFSIQHAYAEGCREVNLSYTRPLLDDGIYWYKRKWGAGVFDVWRERELLLRPTRLTAGITSFLVHHPLLVRQDRQLIGKVMIDRDTVSPADLKRLARRYLSRGMGGLKVFSTRPVPDEAANGGHGPLAPVQVIDLTKCGDPAATFCSA